MRLALVAAQQSCYVSPLYRGCKQVQFPKRYVIKLSRIPDDEQSPANPVILSCFKLSVCLIGHRSFVFGSVLASSSQLMFTVQYSTIYCSLLLILKDLRSFILLIARSIGHACDWIGCAFVSKTGSSTPVHLTL